MRVSCLRTAIVSILVILSGAPFVVAGVKRVSISIEPGRDSFAQGAAVDIVITLRNASNETVGVYPSFSPERVPDFPDTVLLFEVTGPDGTVIKRSHSSLGFDKRKRVSRSDFRELSPGWFFGGPIYINRPPFDYDLSRPGTYKIVARVVFTAQEWLRGSGGKNLGPSEELEFGPDFLEDGSSRSNEVTLRVLP